jgi:uncharacterized membrane protein
MKTMRSSKAGRDQDIQHSPEEVLQVQAMKAEKRDKVFTKLEAFALLIYGILLGFLIGYGG